MIPVLPTTALSWSSGAELALQNPIACIKMLGELSCRKYLVISLSLFEKTKAGIMIVELQHLFIDIVLLECNSFKGNSSRDPRSLYVTVMAHL